MKLTPKIIWLTFFGGALGSLVRWLIGESSETVFALWLVNIAGAFLVGVINSSKSFQTDSVKAFFATGFAGGLTTMSAVAALALMPSFDAISFAAMIAASLLAYWLAVKLTPLVGEKWKA